MKFQYRNSALKSNNDQLLADNNPQIEGQANEKVDDNFCDENET